MSGKINSLDDLRAKIAEMDEEEERQDEEVETEEPVAEEPVAEEEAPKETEEAPKEEDAPRETEEPAEEPVAEEEKPVELDEEGKLPATEEPEKEDFVPEKTYKSMGEEKEYDEFILGAVKTPEQMEAVKRLYQKANGLDYLEQKNTQLNQTNTNLASENENYKNEYGFYNKLLAEGNYHTLFRSINIPDDAILQVAKTILDYSELTPPQKQAYDNSIVNTQRVHTLESENQRFQQQAVDNNVDAQIQQLDNFLLGDTVVNTVNTF